MTPPESLGNSILVEKADDIEYIKKNAIETIKKDKLESNSFISISDGLFFSNIPPINVKPNNVKAISPYT